MAVLVWADGWRGEGEICGVGGAGEKERNSLFAQQENIHVFLYPATWSFKKKTRLIFYGGGIVVCTSRK